MALSPGGLPTTCTVVLLSSKRSTVTVSAQTATEVSTGSRCCCHYCGDSHTKPHIVVNNWYPNSPQSPLPRQQQKKHGGAGAAVAIEGICTLLVKPKHTLGHPKPCKRRAERAADAWESEQTAPSPFPTISPLVPKIRVLLTHIACESHGPAQSRHSVTRSVSQVAPRMRTPDPLSTGMHT